MGKKQSYAFREFLLRRR